MFAYSVSERRTLKLQTGLCPFSLTIAIAITAIPKKKGANDCMYWKDVTILLLLLNTMCILFKELI